MGGISEKVPRPPRVADSLAGNYDAVKPLASAGNRDTKITSQTHGTDAVLRNQVQPNMGEAVLYQPTTVSAKEFKKNVKISSQSHGLV